MSVGRNREADLGRVLGLIALGRAKQTTDVILRDPEILEQLYACVAARVACCRLPAGVEAEVVLIDVWEKLCTATTLDRLPSNLRSPDAFLQAIVTNRIREALRSNRRAEQRGKSTDAERLDLVPAPKQSSRLEILELVDILAKELSPADRKLIWAIDYDEVPTAVYAKGCGCSEETLRVRLYRARKRACAILVAHGVEPPRSSRQPRRRVRTVR